MNVRPYLMTDSGHACVINITATKDIRRQSDQNYWIDRSQYAYCHQAPFQIYPRWACTYNKIKYLKKKNISINKSKGIIYNVTSLSSVIG
jgi:hypothetical protein